MKSPLPVLRVVFLLAVFLSVVALPTGVEAAPAISATKRDQLLIDANANGLAGPGDTLKYTIVITNSGTTTATNVMFSDPLDPNLNLVPGSVNTSPIARNDSYSVIGNVSISPNAAQGLLANDNDPDGTTPTVISVNTAGTQGQVTFGADGSFTFNPNPGFEGTTTFTYTISDGIFTDTGTVTLAVSGMIWFINASGGAGDGRLSSPFNSVANFNSTAADDLGDNIFLFSGNYAGPLTLLNNQRLIGQGAAQSVSAITGLTPQSYSAALPATGGARPVMARTGGDNITLASNNSVYGLDVSASSGRGIFGSSVGTLLITNIGSINTTNGAAVDLANGTLSVTVTNISANGGANGIKLTATAGSFSVPGTGSAGSGGTIQNTTGADSTTAGSGIFLSSANNISLAFMNLHDHENYAIRGTSVTNFTLLNSTITGANGNNEAFNEAAVSFGNLIGAGTILNCTISGGRENNLEVANSAGTLNSLIVSNCLIQANHATLGNHGLFVESSGTAKVTNIVQACTLRTNRVEHFRANALDTGVLDVTFGGAGVFQNTLVGGNTSILAGDIFFSSDDSALIAFDCVNNSINGAKLSAIGIFVANTSLAGTRVAGTISGNAIGTSGVANSGSLQASGISVVGSGLGTVNVAISGNTIRQYNEHGILLQGGDTSPVLNATITGNSIKEPVGFALNGIQLNAGTTAAGTASFCVDIGGVGALENDIVGAGGTGSDDFRLRQRNSSSVRLPGYAGAATDDAAVVAFIQGRNTGTPTGSATHSTLGSAGFLGGAACVAPLLISAGGIPAARATVVNSEPEVKVMSIEAVPTSKPELAPGDSTVRVDQGILDNEKLQPIATAAIQRWLAAGLSTDQSVALNRISFRVTDLAGWYLAASSSGMIQLDRDAAGRGWFIDPTPLDDSEFSTASSVTRLYTDPQSAPAGRIDLLTTVMHEMGHVLGVADSYSEEARESLMYGSLTQGERRLPVKGQAQGALPDSFIGTHFLFTPITIGDLPPGKSVTIVFNVTITNTPTGCMVTNQGSVSGDNFTIVLTDDPDTGAANDPTATPIFIAPVITCPANVTTNNATGLCNQNVSFTATATGCPLPGISYKIGATPISSPHAFPVGTNTVTATATNVAGTNSCTFTVTVNDTQPPAMSVPADITINADTGQCSKSNVTFTANATDNCAASVTVVCTPASGSTFLVGTNVVTCTATDSSSNSSTNSFKVIVRDVELPVITCSTNMVVAVATNQTSAIVNYSVSALDNCSGLTTNCLPPSGSTFALGTNVVTCGAIDTAGNSNGCTFTVVVHRVPTARDDTLGTREGTPAIAPAAKLLANDSDLDSDALSLTAVSATSTNGGTVTLSSGVVTYTPVGSFVGEDRFTYTLTDARGGTNTGTVVVTVTSTNLPSQNQVTVTLTSSGRQIRFAGIPTQNYIIQKAGSVSGPWTDLSPPITAGTTGFVEYLDAEMPPPAVRFYRTVRSP